MSSFAFYGIFRDDQTRRRAFGSDGYKVISDELAVPGWNVDYEYGVARILPSKYGQLRLSLCTLTEEAEKTADAIEGISRGMYRKDMCEFVFKEDWAEQVDPEFDDCKIYMFNTDYPSRFWPPKVRSEDA
jgi:hypothetical protein